MAENQKGPSDAVQKTANAAHAVHGAVKAGKAVAAAAKGAAVGGPYLSLIHISEPTRRS